MRNMLAFLAAATLTLIGVGWYLDWFKLHTVPGDSGHRSVTVDINTAKVKEDLISVEYKVEKKLVDKDKSGKPAAEGAEPVDPVKAAKPVVGKALRAIGEVIDQPNR